MGIYLYIGLDRCFFKPAITTNTTLNTFVETIPTPTGLKSKNTNTLTFYPNPTKSHLTVMLPSSTDAFILKITDQSGRIIKEENDLQGVSSEINLNELTSGMYFLKLTNTQTGVVKNGKVVVE